VRRFRQPSPCFTKRRQIDWWNRQADNLAPLASDARGEEHQEAFLSNQANARETNKAVKCEPNKLPSRSIRQALNGNGRSQ